MSESKAEIARWASGQRLAAARIAREAAQVDVPLSEALKRVDALRDLADSCGASVDRRRAERENLAYHLAWAELRRAFGFG